MKIIPFNEDFAESIYQWYHEPKLRNYFRGYIGGISREQCKQAPTFFRAHLLMGFVNNRLVGMVSLADTSTVMRIYRLGVVVNAEDQKRGHGRELLAAGLQWAFKSMNARKVIFEALSDDARTVKILRLSKFELEGVLREEYYVDGQYKNIFRFGFLKSEYDVVN